MTKAVYAFSGDPITYGHIDIVQRAARTFDSVLVGIGENPSKKYLFSLDEREEMARRSLRHLENVSVTSFTGLLVDYAYEIGAGVIVKGVRNGEDFAYEQTLNQIGESQNDNIDTHVLFAKPELSHVSSSSVKAILKEHGLVHEYVPLYVKQMLEKKVLGQYIVGVTGEIAVGKSFVSNQLVECGERRGLDIHHIELDHIGHDILSSLKEPVYERVREEIAQQFGSSVRLSDGFINRTSLGEIVFADRDKLSKLNDIMKRPMLVRLRREMYDKKGIILLNAALIAESDSGHLCNNNVVVVYSDKESQSKRLKMRDLTDDQINRRLASQYSSDQKRERVCSFINRDNHGFVTGFDNSNENDSNIDGLMDFIVNRVGV